MESAAHSVASAIKLVLPETLLILSACVFFLVAAMTKPRERARDLWAWAALAAVVFAGGVAWFAPQAPTLDVAASPFRSDALSGWIRTLGLAGGLVLILVSWKATPVGTAGEMFACLVLVVAGVNLVGAANDLIGLFLALELISIPTYLMLYEYRQDSKAQEATLKYFLLSVFSSALFLYGLSFIYGATGSTNFEVLRAGLRSTPAHIVAPLFLVGMILVVAGLGFRLTAVPFHFYAPDVFEGTRPNIAAFLALAPKIVGVAAMIRLLGPAFVPQVHVEAPATASGQAIYLVWTLAVLTMGVGNVLALLQSNVRRLLAYSSVAHAGYMLVGLAAMRAGDGSNGAVPSVLFYLAIYGAMTTGLFAVITYLDRPEAPVEDVEDLAGLSETHPAMALLASVFLFSLIGLPPTAGFFGKLYLFLTAWSEGSAPFRAVAVVMAVNAAIGAWYYLRLIGVMYLRPANRKYAEGDLPSAVAAALCGAATVGFFVAPGLLWHWVSHAGV